MTLFDIFLLGLALSVDAFVVSFSYGLVLKPHRMSNGLKLGAAVFNAGYRLVRCSQHQPLYREH